MARRSGQQVMTTPVTFWLSAEEHILTMPAWAAMQDKPCKYTRIHYLTKISDLSIEKHLRLIEENAYYIWGKGGRPFGAEADHWLEAERAYPAGIRKKIAQVLRPDSANSAATICACRRTLSTSWATRRYSLIMPMRARVSPARGYRSRSTGSGSGFQRRGGIRERCGRCPLWWVSYWHRIRRRWACSR